MKKIVSFLLAALLICTLAGCGKSDSTKSNVIYPDADGYAEGRIGDTMHSSFFEYTVNSAYVCDEYAGYLSEAGYELLVVDITVKNVFNRTIEMYDTDFQAQWNDDSEDAYEFSLTLYNDDEPLDDKMLPAVYELGVDQARTGLLVFEVPEGNKDFSLSYAEFFDDESTGDVFFVFFTADKKK